MQNAKREEQESVTVFLLKLEMSAKERDATVAIFGWSLRLQSSMTYAEP
jgi:hypothetical protein